MLINLADVAVANLALFLAAGFYEQETNKTKVYFNIKF